MRSKYLLFSAIVLLAPSCATTQNVKNISKFHIDSTPKSNVILEGIKFCATPCTIEISNSKQPITLEWENGKKINFPYPRLITPEVGMIFFEHGALVKISPHALNVKLLEADDSLNDNYR